MFYRKQVAVEFTAILSFEFEAAIPASCIAGDYTNAYSAGCCLSGFVHCVGSFDFISSLHSFPS